MMILSQNKEVLLFTEHIVRFQINTVQTYDGDYLDSSSDWYDVFDLCAYDVYDNSIFVARYRNIEEAKESLRKVISAISYSHGCECLSVDF